MAARKSIARIIHFVFLDIMASRLTGAAGVNLKTYESDINQDAQATRMDLDDASEQATAKQLLRRSSGIGQVKHGSGETVLFHEVAQGPEEEEETQWAQTFGSIMQHSFLSMDMPVPCPEGFRCTYGIDDGPMSFTMDRQQYQSIVRHEYHFPSDTQKEGRAQLYMNTSSAVPYAYLFFPQRFSHFCKHEILIRGPTLHVEEVQAMQIHDEVDSHGSRKSHLIMNRTRYGRAKEKYMPESRQRSADDTETIDVGSDHLVVSESATGEDIEIQSGNMDMRMHLLRKHPAEEHAFHLPASTKSVHVTEIQFKRALMLGEIPEHACQEPVHADGIDQSIVGQEAAILDNSLSRKGFFDSICNIGASALSFAGIDIHDPWSMLAHAVGMGHVYSGIQMAQIYR